MFGFRVGFSGSADRMALVPVGWLPSFKVLNGHISATGHPIHFLFGSWVKL